MPLSFQYSKLYHHIQAVYLPLSQIHYQRIAESISHSFIPHTHFSFLPFVTYLYSFHLDLFVSQEHDVNCNVHLIHFLCVAYFLTLSSLPSCAFCFLLRVLLVLCIQTYLIYKCYMNAKSAHKEKNRFQFFSIQS
jgi:hypothetical protein